MPDAQPTASPFEHNAEEPPTNHTPPADTTVCTGDLVVATISLTEVKRWIVLGFLAVLFALAFVFVGALFKAASPEVTAVITVSAMVAGAALVGVVLYRRESSAANSLAARLSASPRNSWSTVLADTFVQMRHSPSYVLPRMASQLISSGQSQFAIAAVNKGLDDIQPIDVPFEPIPLIESHPSFALFLTSRTRIARNPAAQSSEYDAPEWLLAAKRAIALIGGPWMALLFVFLVGMSVLDAIREWSIPASLWPWPLFVLLLILSATNCGAWSSYIQYFLVPGGVVVRWTNSILRAQQHLRLYERDRAGLAMWQTNKHAYSLCLVNDDGRMQTTCTRNEAIAVLRAWFSDLAPPSVEQLSDLT